MLNTSEKLLCTVYRVERKEGAYLYTPLAQGGRSPLDELPEAMLERLGPLTESMKLVLTPDRKLANANAEKVIQAINEKGFYLQLPPVEPSMARENR